MSDPGDGGRTPHETRTQRREQRHLTRLQRAQRRYERMNDDYALVLMLIVVMLVATAVLGLRGRDAPIELVLLVTTLVVTMRASQVSPRIVRLTMLVLFPFVLAVAIFNEVGANDATLTVTLGVAAALAVIAPAVIMRRLVHHAAVTTRTILGALCIYLLIGYFFAFLYSLINLVAHAGFFAEGKEAGFTKPNILYFSYATLTTVGYGDFSPVGTWGKTLSVTEALVGQLYLVTIVALLVGNMGRGIGSGGSRDVGGGERGGEGAAGEAD